MSNQRTCCSIFVGILFALVITTFPVKADTTTISGAEAVILELDHIYICVTKDAPEARILQDAGLQLAGDTAHHTGQGTASVFFFFENTYLELIWIENIDELEKADILLAEKFKNVASKGSPFGLGLRRSKPSLDSLPFNTRPYFEDWVKPGTTIEIADVKHATEPDIFVVPPYMGWDSITAHAQKSQSDPPGTHKHPAGIRKLTGITIMGPELPTESKAIYVLANQGIVKFCEAEEHIVELTFDEGSKRETIDGQPDLPLIIHY